MPIRILPAVGGPGWVRRLSNRSIFCPHFCVNVFFVPFLVSFSIEIHLKIPWKIEPRCSLTFGHDEFLVFFDSVSELIEVDIPALLLELMDLLKLRVIKFNQFQLIWDTQKLL